MVYTLSCRLPGELSSVRCIFFLKFIRNTFTSHGGCLVASNYIPALTSTNIKQMGASLGAHFSKIRAFGDGVIWRCTVKKLFLEIVQTSQENTCARVSFL